MSGARAVTSSSPRAAKIRAAVSGEAETRCTSSNHSICSGVPSGRNIVVNVRRKAALDRPQPTRIIVASVSFSSAEATLSRRARPRAKPPHTMKCVTRPGLRAMYSMLSAAPCERPSSANVSSPAASTTHSRSRTQRSSVNASSPTSRSDSPHPRSS